MAKRVPWNALLEVIGRFPQGISLEEIMLGLDPAVPRRTLQRWLASLAKNNEVHTLGEGRSRRYKLAHILPPLRSIPFAITEDATFVLAKVSRPLQDRKPVTYNREFLESYKPNVTYYLSTDLRKKLLEMGRTQDGKYPAGTYARHIFQRLLIDLSWNSSRLEGNTYSLLETERLLKEGYAAAGKDLKETQMILNHKAAIEFLIDSAEEIGVNRFTILNLHTLLSDNLMPDPAASGRLRTFSVGITHSTYLPIAIPQVFAIAGSIYVAKTTEPHCKENEQVLEDKPAFIFVDPPQDFSSRFEVARCFCEHDGKLLYMLRNPEKPEGNTWCLPGGKLDQGETALNAVIREVEEETGIGLPEDSLIFCKKVYVRLPQKDFVLHLFKAKLKEVPETFNIARDEHIAFRWVTCEQALAMPLIPGGRDCLRFVYRK